VVGDTLYGAPRVVQPVVVAKGIGSRNKAGSVEQGTGDSGFELDRNFLHATELEFAHPRTNERLALDAELPEELVEVLERVRGAELVG
jgi:23S rRNA pseudouridine1911/1915/1917 synthase